jgi:hypothetical protein
MVALPLGGDEKQEQRGCFHTICTFYNKNNDLKFICNKKSVAGRRKAKIRLPFRCWFANIEHK